MTRSGISGFLGAFWSHWRWEAFTRSTAFLFLITHSLARSFMRRGRWLSMGNFHCYRHFLLRETTLYFRSFGSIGLTSVGPKWLFTIDEDSSHESFLPIPRMACEHGSSRFVDIFDTSRDSNRRFPYIVRPYRHLNVASEAFRMLMTLRCHTHCVRLFLRVSID